MDKDALVQELASMLDGKLSKHAPIIKHRQKLAAAVFACLFEDYADDIASEEAELMRGVD